MTRAQRLFKRQLLEALALLSRTQLSKYRRGTRFEMSHRIS